MLQSGFFNAHNGDRTYNADDFNEFFNGILTDNGVYKKSGNGLQVVPGSGMSVNITTGRCRIQQHFVAVSAAENVALAASSLTLNRYDAIVLRYDAQNRQITAEAITGTPASSPVKPSIMRTVNTYDMCLAYVYVPAGSSTVSTGNIEDTREDNGVCGFAKLQIDAINAGIREYRNVINVDSNTSSINIGIPEFDSANDLLSANINGVLFVQGTDYTVSGSGSQAVANFTSQVRAGNTVEFKVIKSVIEVL